MNCITHLNQTGQTHQNNHLWFDRSKSSIHRVRRENVPALLAVFARCWCLPPSGRSDVFTTLLSPPAVSCRPWFHGPHQIRCKCAMYWIVPVTFQWLAVSCPSLIFKLCSLGASGWAEPLWPLLSSPLWSTRKMKTMVNYCMWGASESKSCPAMTCASLISSWPGG